MRLQQLADVARERSFDVISRDDDDGCTDRVKRHWRARGGDDRLVEVVLRVRRRKESGSHGEGQWRMTKIPGHRRILSMHARMAECVNTQDDGARKRLRSLSRCPPHWE